MLLRLTAGERNYRLNAFWRADSPPTKINSKRNGAPIYPGNVRPAGARENTPIPVRSHFRPVTPAQAAIVPAAALEYKR